MLEKTEGQSKMCNKETQSTLGLRHKTKKAQNKNYNTRNWSL